MLGRTTVAGCPLPSSDGPSRPAGPPAPPRRREGAVRDVRQGGGLQHLAERHPGGDPHPLELGRGARRRRPPRGAPRTSASGPSTARMTSATRHSRGGPGEPVAAVGAALAADERRSAQLGQDALEEPDGDPLGGRRRPRPSSAPVPVDAACGRQLDRGPHGVVDLGRDAHGARSDRADAARGSPRAVVRRCSRSTCRSRPFVR